MQVQDLTFGLLLLIVAALPLAAKGLAEIYIVIAARIQELKRKNRKPSSVLLKR